MNRDLIFSVCLASYNGEKFIYDQVLSIMNQLTEYDELIVSDDSSKDNTLEILKKLQKKYFNIKIIKGPEMGFSCNFGNAVSFAKGDIILFSDQDDIWMNQKIDEIYNCFKLHPDCTTILHKMATFRDEEDVDTNEFPISYHRGVIRNFIKSSYWGCCMAVKKNFLNDFLPFRNYCVGHDQLTGLMTEKYGKCYFLDEKLIKHRFHDKNTSRHRNIFEMLEFRKELLKDYKVANKIYKIKNRGIK